MKRTTLTFSLLAALALARPGRADTPPPPDAPLAGEQAAKAAQDAKMRWFREARFGIFFNFGLYSYYGGIWKGQVRMANRCSEWMMIAAKASVAEYAAAAAKFNPEGFDADEWIRAVRDAGARYVVFDAKHHDGFALFKSEASDFNIVDATPFKRDVVAEIAAACRRYGVRFGIYYSQNLDWHHPGGGGGGWDPAQKGRIEDYLDNVCIPQLRELLTNYGKVDILWYDISNGTRISQAYAERIDRMVRELQPGIIVNNRLRRGIPYDIQTPENFVPATGIPGVDWETCLTFNHSWGFSAVDHDWKSARDVIHRLCDIASKGGNLLLNLGPDAYGVIPRPCLDRLDVIGAWLGENGQAIYGTQASPFPSLPAWGRFTVRPGRENDTLHAIVFDPPKDGALLLPGLANAIRSVRLLAPGGRAFPIEGEGPARKVRLDATAMAAKDFVIAIELEGRARIGGVAPTEEGILRCPPSQALAFGDVRLGPTEYAGLANRFEERLIGWGSPKSAAKWTLALPKPGRYALTLRYAAGKEAEGCRLRCEVAGQALSAVFTATNTGAANRYIDLPLGEVSLPAGESTLVVRPEVPAKGDALQLAVITLKPLP